MKTPKTDSTQPAPPRADLPGRERFIGEGLIPEGVTFDAGAMARGGPGLPAAFVWRGRRLAIAEVLETWKGTGDCRHGSGERYVRKHWFRVRTADGLELQVYFERQRRSSGGARWRLFSAR